MDRGAIGFAARIKFENADGRSVLREGRPLDVKHVVEPLELDCSIDAQIWARAFWQSLVKRDIYRHRALLHGGIDANDVAGNDTVARINRSRLIDLNIFRL